LVLIVLILVADDPKEGGDYERGRGLTVAIFLSLVGVHAIISTHTEIQILLYGPEGKLGYFTDMFRYWAAARIWLSYAAIVLFFTGPEMYFREVLAVLASVYTFGLFGYFQPLPFVGPPVKMMIAILVDILDILVVLTLMLAGYSFSMFLLMAEETPPEDSESDQTGFQTVNDAFFTTYKQVFLAAFDDRTYIFGRYKVISTILFVIVTFLGTVVVLNLLIARMSDSYERIQEEAEFTVLRLKAQILIQIEMKLSKADKANPRWFPRWIHVLVPSGGNQAQLANKEWAGVLASIKSEIASFTKKIIPLTKDITAFAG